MKTFLFIIFLFNYINSNPCIIDIGNKKFDLSTLSTETGYSIQQPRGTYSFNICKNLPVPCKNTKIPSFVRASDTECFATSKSFQAPDVQTKLINNAIILNYFNGDEIVPGIRQGTSIEITCSNTPTPVVTLENPSVLPGHAMVNYKLKTNKVCSLIDTPCLIKGKNWKIDLSKLKHPREYVIQKNGKEYYFNICGLTQTSCRNERFPSFRKEESTCIVASKSLSSQDAQSKLLFPNQPEYGALLEYKNGQHVNGLIQGTRFILFCDKNAVTPRFELSEARVDDYFYTVIQVYSKDACPVYNQDELCKFTLPQGGKVDLNPLKQNSEITVQGDGFHDILFNFCEPVKNPRVCSGSSGHPAVHVHWQNINDCNYISGKLNDEKNVDMEVLDKSNPELGVVLVYKNGEKFEQGGQVLGSETRIEIRCNKNVELAPVTFKSSSPRGSVMVYTLMTSSKHACSK